jgi:transposase-like protein
MKRIKRQANPEMKALAKEIAKGVKTQEDLSNFTSELIKNVVEAALNVEMSTHLGYEKYASAGKNTGNSRNGCYPKTLKGSQGVIDIEVPRDRNGVFEPQLVEKGQTRFTAFDEQILACYARGMSTRDIAATFEEMYGGAKVSHTVISQVTEAVLEEVTAWQNRPLDEVYPVVYLDCLVVKVHQDKQVLNKSIYLALGINLEGKKELLGLWISQNEGAKFWMNVLTELQNRGVKDILIACVDGLTGFPEAIETVFPKTTVQLCIVHLIRNSLKYVSYKERKEVASDLKRIYRSISVEEAEAELKDFGQKWDGKYPSIAKLWDRQWTRVIPFLEFPQEIRKVIYTTNAIESLNSVIRKAINNRKIFPSDRSALKTVYLAVKQAAKKWTMPLHNWGLALQRFSIHFEGRLPI